MTLLLRRAVAIVVRPSATWAAIAAERVPLAAVFLTYVAPLAALGPVATFVALRVEGERSGNATYHASVSTALSEAFVSYGFALAGVLLVAAIVNALAPRFGCARDYGRAYRTVAYAFTPAWLGAALIAVPGPLRYLQLAAAAYAVFELCAGLAAVMGATRSRAAAFAAASLAVALVAAFTLGILAAEVRALGGPSTATGSRTTHEAAAGRVWYTPLRLAGGWAPRNVILSTPPGPEGSNGM